MIKGKQLSELPKIPNEKVNEVWKRLGPFNFDNIEMNSSKLWQPGPYKLESTNSTYDG